MLEELVVQLLLPERKFNNFKTANDATVVDNPSQIKITKQRNGMRMQILIQRFIPKTWTIPQNSKTQTHARGRKYHRTIDREEAGFPEKDLGAKALAPVASTKAETHPEVKFTMLTIPLLLHRNNKD